MDPPPLAPIPSMAASSALGSSATVAAAAASSSMMSSSSSSADPDPSTQPYHFSPESVRVYAETLNTAVGEEVARELAEDLTFRCVLYHRQIFLFRESFSFRQSCGCCDQAGDI